VAAQHLLGQRPDDAASAVAVARSALGRAVPSALDLEVVHACLNVGNPLDRLFARAIEDSLRART
jgi:hypothetical protein